MDRKEESTFPKLTRARDLPWTDFLSKSLDRLGVALGETEGVCARTAAFVFLFSSIFCPSPSRHLSKRSILPSFLPSIHPSVMTTEKSPRKQIANHNYSKRAYKVDGYKSFEEFYPYYLSEHCNTINRRLHLFCKSRDTKRSQSHAPLLFFFLSFVLLYCHCNCPEQNKPPWTPPRTFYD